MKEGYKKLYPLHAANPKNQPLGHLLPDTAMDISSKRMMSPTVKVYVNKKTGIFLRPIEIFEKRIWSKW